MIKVITYGTFDLLHYGHIRLLERAKALGDYLVVGVTSDDFDKARGKINNKQSLIERIEAVKRTGLANEIIVEEFEGQKIDDILRLGIDIFTVGSDWTGKFDYLKDYCKVIYLPRTEGISSSEIRTNIRTIRIGLVGNARYLEKMITESKYVNGIIIEGIYDKNTKMIPDSLKDLVRVTTDDYQALLDRVDAVYIISHPSEHYENIKKALDNKKHVLCESPIVTDIVQFDELKKKAEQNNTVLMDAIRTAYSVAYERLLLLIKSGKIGKVISVDSTCTSLRPEDYSEKIGIVNTWNSICTWGPAAMLPIFHLLGVNYIRKEIYSSYIEKNQKYDSFTKIEFLYPDAVASIKVAKGVKSEGELIVSGTEGYIYVPAPWWKTEYFELRCEDPTNNKRYYYQLDGEGIRYEFVEFLKMIERNRDNSYISSTISRAIVNVINDYYQDKDVTSLS